jgi:hypothetical protein
MIRTSTNTNYTLQVSDMCYLEIQLSGHIHKTSSLELWTFKVLARGILHYFRGA